MRRILVFFAGLVLLLSSCVTNKKYVYLQKDDLNKKDLKRDTTVRTYAPSLYEYRIQPEDIVSVRFESLSPKDIDIFNTKESTQTNNNVNFTGGNALLLGELVDQEGEIPFPFIGKIKVSGLTVFEVQDSLQKIAVQYLESPVVKVRLLNFRFTLLGEVTKEGTTMLTNNRVSILEAIGWAGGLTDLADRSNVKLIRQFNGETTVQYLNLLDEDFIDSPYYYVHQNDVIVVSALKQRPYRKYFGQNLAFFVSSATLVLLIINLTR